MPVGQTQYAWSAGANITNPAGTRGIVNCAVAPAVLTAVRFWVKATAGTSTVIDGSAISTWSDQSGNGRNATQATAANQPTYFDNSTDNMNFNPVVNFDAASQVAANGNYMDIAAMGYSPRATTHILFTLSLSPARATSPRPANISLQVHQARMI